MVYFPRVLGGSVKEVQISGHSKWATIKREKAKTDSARGAVFTQMSREIIVAAKLGGPDPAANFRLRTAIEKAKQAGVPNDNIKRAIAKGAGSEEADHLEEVRYEGYGPSGVAILVQTVTDNRNRTVADLRAAFTRNGGNLGETGCVGWMFAHKGLIRVPADGPQAVTEEEVLAAALEAGAQDLRQGDDAFEITCEIADLEAVQTAIQQAGIPVESAEFIYFPANTVEITDPEVARKLLRLIDRLEDLDDVQKVACNFDLDAALLSELGLSS